MLRSSYLIGVTHVAVAKCVVWVETARCPLASTRGRLEKGEFMTSAWTNLSFAIMHRDIEREWENQGGVDL
ncbi:hypothetical protein NC652_028917 [Populus alba x Populus x berolinensis]|nr:hypothetical protein NC652_028917 [Populus alba x Populus x berolinensis]